MSSKPAMVQASDWHDKHDKLDRIDNRGAQPPQPDYEQNENRYLAMYLRINLSPTWLTRWASSASIYSTYLRLMLKYEPLPTE